jgi:hypothetical protein
VDRRWNYYRDVAVLAVPRVAAHAAVAPEQMINLTDRMDATGRIKWNPPNGKWRIIRLGHTTTGVPTHPTTKAGGGLECDKLSRALIVDVGPPDFRLPVNEVREDSRLHPLKQCVR